MKFLVVFAICVVTQIKANAGIAKTFLFSLLRNNANFIS